ncbi:MAG: helix-turn-helix transcriptional regulator [Gammaproteobacteria bacterium]|nr:helix-turn-helix transcriptional regulator [Gammaproteobacteria bacterium]
MNNITRVYSLYSQDALILLGRLIRAARKEQKLTEKEISDRAGISRGLLNRIEKGDPKCQIGAVFEVATIVGVKLFDANEKRLKKHLRQTEEKLSLLPKTVHKTKRKIDDDF